MVSERATAGGGWTMDFDSVAIVSSGPNSEHDVKGVRWDTLQVFLEELFDDCFALQICLDTVALDRMNISD